jgi:hypothetical protein
MHIEAWRTGEFTTAADSDLKVRAGTLAIDKDVDIWEYNAVMVNGMTISGDMSGDDQGVNISFDIIARSLDRDSSINTTPSTWNYTFREKVMMSDLDFRMDAYSDSASLDSNDVYGIQAFEINYANNLLIQMDSESGTKIVEPTGTGRRDVTGSFTFGRYTADTFLDDMNSDTVMMADLKFTGGVFTGTSAYQFNIYLPSFKFVNAAVNVAGPEVFPWTLDWRAQKPAGAASGFPAEIVSGDYKEIQIEMQNQITTNLIDDGTP